GSAPSAGEGRSASSLSPDSSTAAGRSSRSSSMAASTWGSLVFGCSTRTEARRLGRGASVVGQTTATSAVFVICLSLKVIAPFRFLVLPGELPARSTRTLRHLEGAGSSFVSARVNLKHGGAARGFPLCAR